MQWADPKLLSAFDLPPRKGHVDRAPAPCAAGERRLSLTVRRVLKVRSEDEEQLETEESRREAFRLERAFMNSISDAGLKPGPKDST
jgi:hypothetical protein